MVAEFEGIVVGRILYRYISRWPSCTSSGALSSALLSLVGSSTGGLPQTPTEGANEIWLLPQPALSPPSAAHLPNHGACMTTEQGNEMQTHKQGLAKIAPKWLRLRKLKGGGGRGEEVSRGEGR